MHLIRNEASEIQSKNMKKFQIFSYNLSTYHPLPIDNNLFIYLFIRNATISHITHGCSIVIGTRFSFILYYNYQMSVLI